jgi:hypothetical protein
MTANIRYFQGDEGRNTRLRVRGFAADGMRTGGIINPQEVEVPVNAILFRAFHDPSRRFGEWWFTPHEMTQIADYFGVSSAGFAIGRAIGKSIMHATLAVRHDWGGNSPDHLGRFLVIRLTAPLTAYHGESDHAPDAAYRQMQKASRIIDRTGRQRFARQVFLPKFWEFQATCCQVLPLVADSTDADLMAAVARFGNGPLPFET